MAKHRGIWPLSWLCEALDVSRGGYYGWLKRPRSAHAQRDEELLSSIRRSFADSDRTYGARRVRRDLRAWDQPCGIHRVERLMLAAGLEARRKRRRCRSTWVSDLLTRSPGTSWIATLPPRLRTSAGSPISRICGPMRAGCTSRSCWICSRDSLWAGPCSRAWRHSSSVMRC